jgi:hypothetical protein
MRSLRGTLGVLVAIGSAPAPGQEFLVSARSRLTNAFREIGKALEVASPGTSVVFNLAASDGLLAQIGSSPSYPREHPALTCPSSMAQQSRMPTTG